MSNSWVRDADCCVPFLKWAGGKRWLVYEHIGLFPKTFSRYIEPFLGSGSVFFGIAPSRSILADTNARLIETFTQVRDNPLYVYELLRHHHSFHSDEYYYQERQNNYSDSACKRAAQFIYLNRTCWNGLYRVNRLGKFNVPRGTKSSVLLDTDDFPALANALSQSELLAQDFSYTMARAGAGDFVYIDPPYTVRHKYNGFVKYNEKIFCWEDQVRLCDEVKGAVERGAMVAISNADHDSVRELYRSVGSFRSVSRKSVIAADAENRGIVDELLILSWEK